MPAFRGFFIGAAGQPDVVGVMAAGGKDLLPVDNIVIAVADRGGGERRQVGAGIGFRCIRWRNAPPARIAGRNRFFCRRCRGPQRRGLRFVASPMAAGHRPCTASLVKICCSISPKPLPPYLRPADTEAFVRSHPLDDPAVGRAVPVGQHLAGIVGRHEPGEVRTHFATQGILLGVRSTSIVVSSGSAAALRAPSMEASSSSCTAAPPTRRARSLATEK